MVGTNFVINEQRRKTAASIDLKIPNSLLEDIQDVLVSWSRREEKQSPLDRVRGRLVAAGKLRS